MTDSTLATTTAPPVPVLDATAPGGGHPAPSARLYMTSDLRAATGLSRTHMDYYLREGLIVPTARSESGYLLFDETELSILRSILADRRAGIPLREIRRRLGR